MSNQKKFASSRTIDNQVIMLGLVFIMFFCVILFSFSISTSQPGPNGQQAAQGSGEPGKAIFEEKCIACHTIGGGKLVGPDLEGVAERQTREWLLEWIQSPDDVLARGDEYATDLLQKYNNVAMPNLSLSEDQAADVLAYLENPSGETSPQAVPQGGNATEGEALFTGSTSLENGGPACMSCHSTTGVGVLGGGTLGPDLTNVYTRYGEGLSSTLESLPFPTMQGVFAENPLTDNEIADLYAYFVKADENKSGPISFDFVWIGLGGFLVFSLMIQLNWRKRLTGVRKPLLGDSK